MTTPNLPLVPLSPQILRELIQRMNAATGPLASEPLPANFPDIHWCASDAPGKD
jgi:hypothetical protein